MSKPPHRVSIPTYFSKPDLPTYHHGRMRSHPSAQPEKSGRHAFSRPRHGVLTPHNVTKPAPPTSHRSEMRSHFQPAGPQKADRHGLSGSSSGIPAPYNSTKPSPNAYYENRSSHSRAPPKRDNKHEMSGSSDNVPRRNYFAKPAMPTDYHGDMRPHYPLAPPRKDGHHCAQIGQRKLTMAALPTLDKLDALHQTMTLESLKERFEVLCQERALIERRLADRKLLEKFKEAAEREQDMKRIQSLRQLKIKNPNIDPFGVPIPPPKPCQDLWAKAKSRDDTVYYYHKGTGKSQWHPPTPAQGILEPEPK